MDGECDKLVTGVGHQFFTLTVHICVQRGGREAQRPAGLSAAAETCSYSCAAVDKISTDRARRAGLSVTAELLVIITGPDKEPTVVVLCEIKNVH